MGPTCSVMRWRCCGYERGEFSAPAGPLCDGGIGQDWAGDDQDWWDWYVTLAENDDAPIALVAGPGLPDVDRADGEQLRVELAAPTDLMLPSVKPSVVMPSSSWRMCFRSRQSYSVNLPSASTTTMPSRRNPAADARRGITTSSTSRSPLFRPSQHGSRSRPSRPTWAHWLLPGVLMGVTWSPICHSTRSERHMTRLSHVVSSRVMWLSM